MKNTNVANAFETIIELTNIETKKNNNKKNEKLSNINIKKQKKIFLLIYLK